MSESVPVLDDDEISYVDGDEYDDTDLYGSHVHHPPTVLIRLSKKASVLHQGPVIAYEGIKSGSSSSRSSIVTADANSHLFPRCRVSATPAWCQDDEGYNDEATAKDDDEEDDDEDDDNELESVSVFLPLTIEELAGMAERNEMLRNTAARTIQACWRGYWARKQQKKGFVGLVSGLASICTRLHHRQMTRMTQRLETLQRRIDEERAMRIGFEKAMEEMTILIDKQQTMLYNRIEQIQIDCDQRIAAESQKRLALEESMNRVLLEMQDMQHQQQRRANEEAEHTRELQKKLDLALQQLKKSIPGEQQQRSSTPSSSLLLSSSSVRTGARRHTRTPAASILDRSSASSLRTTLTTQRRRA
ncbi:hypothetical protein BX666DRAFT_1971684 [Dichotomocladium elegans]|nr:hypothetical protein BX666DRAFT_1971684 [Dichotomocladium elegans]